MENANDTRLTTIIGTDVSKNERLIDDHAELLTIVNALKEKGLRVVYTVGVYDMYHIGHARYLEKARECGNVLIVGIDSDEFTRQRKGPDRPIAPYDERSEILTHDRSVNIVTMLNSSEESSALLHSMRPDVMVLSFSSTKENFDDYAKKMHEKYDPYCQRVEILERQAETSTSARLSMVIIGGAKKLLEKISKASEELALAVTDFLKSAKGEEV